MKIQMKNLSSNRDRNRVKQNLVQPLTTPSQTRDVKGFLRDKVTQFAQTFNLGTRYWHPSQFSEVFDHSDVIAKKDLRIKVLNFTLNALEDGKYYALSDGVTVQVDIKDFLSLSRHQEGFRNILYLETDFIHLSELPKIHKTCIRFLSIDSIDAGRLLIKEGKNPVILNLANQNHPGGGYKNGAGAQEESLFRRSNYCEFLCRETSLYPIPEFGGIYSRNVLVFREWEGQGYAFSVSPFFISFIAQAAYNKPPLTKDDRLTDVFEKGTEMKIRSILKIGLNHGHDSIVLGAFGCGAFSNPPYHIAEIFGRVIKEFDGLYSDIVFAIIEDPNSTKMSRIGNFAVFKQVLS